MSRRAPRRASATAIVSGDPVGDESEFDLEWGGDLEIHCYVGGGDVESIDINIPKAWLTVPDGEWQPLVEAHKKTEFDKRAAAETATAVARAQQEIAAAQAVLRRHGA